MAGSFQGVIPFRLDRRAALPSWEPGPAGSSGILPRPSPGGLNRDGVAGFCPGLASPSLAARDRGQESLAQREARLSRSMNPAELKRFEHTFLPHMSAAYNLARWLTRSDADAEDVVQEAYLRAVRFFGSFRGENSKAWLLAIVRNAGYTCLQRSQAQGPTTPFDAQIHDVEDGGQGPEMDLIRSATRQELLDALEGLPVEFREALVLRELEGLSYKEIAEVSGLPMGTVMSRLTRARRRLRQILIDRGAKED
jgi:RNA polymerase sigma factor (sigma-70 family)